MEQFLPSEEQDQHFASAMAIQLLHAFVNANPALEPLRSKLPVVKAILPLRNKPSQLFPLPLENADESTIDGNGEYLRLILRQFLKIPVERFKDMVLPIYDDAFTVQKLRQLVEQMLEDSTKDPFEQMQFPEPFLGLFHFLVSTIL
jgi:hypothetical protein